MKIGAIDYKIKYIAHNELTSDKCGLTDHTTNTIYIDSTLSKEYQDITLWHEVIHALNSELEEETVDFLAHAIYQVIKENEKKS